MFQYRDQTWNHGEGFAVAADSGGWHGIDTGQGLTLADIQTTANWHGHQWLQPLHPQSGVQMQRFVGHLRPAGLQPATYHVRYGTTGNYVDQAAFELFRPAAAWNPSTQKIVIVIGLFPTTVFPKARITSLGTQYDWHQRYMGFFSPDGLIRDEKGLAVADFQTNVASHTSHGYDPNNPGVKRPLSEQVVGTWPDPNTYPIVGYIVPTVIQRQTELVQQRCFQLVAAIKLLLQENSTRNPAGQVLTGTQLQQVTVVFGGGSNGGLQSCWAAMCYPHIVHGAFCQAINPSIQRLVGEQDFGYATAALTGSRSIGADFDPIDMRNWGHYCWNRGFELYDLSQPLRHLRGETYRPFFFYVGDEDLTSTGTDWIRLLGGGGYQPYGIDAPAPYWAGGDRSVAWTSAEKRCHDSGLFVDPYQPAGLQLHDSDVIHHVVARACTNRAAELASNTVLPDPPFLHLPSANSLFRAEDPQEWFHGSDGDSNGLAPAVGPRLVRDDTWSGVGPGSPVQPGAAGTWLGHKEAMLIHNQKVYVGSAEGLVTSFEVDATAPGMPLRRVAQSRQLGQQAWGMALLSEGTTTSIVVATRRRLFKLDPDNLTVTGQSVRLPWEVAKPYRLEVTQSAVLPGVTGPLIIYASVHGGLVFCDATLWPIYEWSEPGILDFVLQGTTVSIMSERGVLANVVFQASGSSWSALLTAASAPVETSSSSPPCQGTPVDLELVKLNLGGLVPILVGLYNGDVDGLAVRVFMPDTLDRFWSPSISQLSNIGSLLSGNGAGGVDDLGSCKFAPGSGPIGDRPVLLSGSNLVLWSEAGIKLASMDLTRCVGASGTADYLFGRQACSFAVGEMVANSGQYTEEIVVATQTGHVFWLHAQELADSSGVLPAAFAGQVGGAGSHIQPRTNQALSATWAISGPLSTDNPPVLHVLDPMGHYWKVGASGSPELADKHSLAAERRTWRHAGGSFSVSAFAPWITSPTQGSLVGWFSRPRAPGKPGLVPFEAQPGVGPVGEWDHRSGPAGAFYGHFLSLVGGDAAVLPGGSTVAFSWIERMGANLLEGVRINNGALDGYWASTGSTAPTQGPHLYLDLRNEVPGLPGMNMQALRIVPLSSGAPVLMLGCPGGRVRAVQPGSWSDGAALHSIGSLSSLGVDLGHGGAALAVSPAAPGMGYDVDIWLGIGYGHAPRPASYAAGPAVDMGLGEVLTGSVARLTWSAASGFALSGLSGVVSLPPTSTQPTGTSRRGGFGVCGLAVADLFGDVPGKEVVVTTMAGDLYIFNESLQQVVTQTWVDGALGFYNSIVVANLDGIGGPELYLAGSRSIWKFTVL